MAPLNLKAPNGEFGNRPCPPFCWQNRLILEAIRERVPPGKRTSALMVYVALSELASIAGCREFDALLRDLATKSGLGRRTVISRLRELRQCGFIAVKARADIAGNRLASRVRLLRPGEMRVSPSTRAAPPPDGTPDTPCNGFTTPSAVALGPVLGLHTFSNKEEEESPQTPYRQNAAQPPPSIEVVKAFAREHGMNESRAAEFHAHNNAGGWQDGKGQPIRIWQQALIAFVRRHTASGGSRARVPRPRLRRVAVLADHSKGFDHG